MKSIRELKKWLVEHHHIDVRANQIQKLRNLGYYHGYKGYRFIKTPSSPIEFTSLKQLISINEFDMKLKTLFYPKVMFIETALKNYVIESVIKTATERNMTANNIDSIFNTCLTEYKNHYGNPKCYKTAYSKRIKLRGRINSTLAREYGLDQQITKHFISKDISIPIWAVFESLSLGDFALFFECCDKNIKLNTSRLLSLPKNLDTDGMITFYIINTIRDLRNSIAHNNIIFDTRFKSIKGVNQSLIKCLQRETGINDISFKYINDYIILIVYILRSMKITKSECTQFINNFTDICESLRTQLPYNIFSRIIPSDLRPKINQLKTFFNNSK